MNTLWKFSAKKCNSSIKIVRLSQRGNTILILKIYYSILWNRIGKAYRKCYLWIRQLQQKYIHFNQVICMKHWWKHLALVNRKVILHQHDSARPLVAKVRLEKLEGNNISVNFRLSLTPEPQQVDHSTDCYFCLKASYLKQKFKLNISLWLVKTLNEESDSDIPQSECYLINNLTLEDSCSYRPHFFCI